MWLTYISIGNLPRKGVEKMAKGNGLSEKSMGSWATWLLVVGALNWGLVGLLNVNLVNWLFGSWPMVERVVYVLVGLAGVYKLYGMTMR